MELVIVPGPTSVDYGSTIYMACVATGDQPDISWSLDGVALVNGNDFTITTSNITEGGVTFVQSILEVCTVDGSETGEYSCTALNSEGSDAGSWNVDLVGAQAAELVIVPESEAVDYGSTVMMACVAYGFPLPSLTFYKDGTPVDDSSDLVTINQTIITEGEVDFVQSILELCSVTNETTGSYSCTASNDQANMTQSWDLELTSLPAPPELVIVPNSKAVDYNSTVLIACVAYGLPLPSISFTKDGQAVDNSSGLLTITNEVVTEGGVEFVQSILEICSTGVENTGVYNCTATNDQGTDSRSWTLELTFIPVAPEVVIVPESQSVDYGSTVLMTCVAYGTPEPTISFFKDGVSVDDTSEFVFIYTTFVSEGDLNFTQSILEVCSIGLDNVGEYSCTAANNVSSDSRTWSLSLTSQPLSAELVIVPRDKTVDEGSTVLMTCVAYGSPLPDIMWTKDGVEVNNDTSALVTVYTSVVTEQNVEMVQSILEICSISEEYGGGYNCTATNDLGSQSFGWQVTLTPGNRSKGRRVLPRIMLFLYLFSCTS